MTNEWVVASAPGKVILAGEHFVVRGEPAIAMAISLRARAYARFRRDKDIVIESEDLKVRSIPTKGIIKEELTPIVSLVNKIIKMSDCNRGIELRIRSEIPPASGMGSSAAVAVACVAALNGLLNLNLGLDEVCKMAYEAEVIVHKRPSGIDNTISTYGGVILYHKEKGFERIQYNMKGYKFILADSGLPRNTGVMVSNVLSLYDKYKRALEHVYRASRELVMMIVDALRRGDAEMLGDLMNINHGLLSAIGVSNAKLEELVYTARMSGARGAKITGAGGGGFIVALVDNSSYNKVMTALRTISPRVFVTEISEDGVKIEKRY